MPGPLPLLREICPAVVASSGGVGGNDGYLTAQQYESLQENQADEGSYAIAGLYMPDAPTNNQTVTIGGHVFIFKTTLGAAGAQTQIEISGTYNEDLRDAINGTTNARVVQATAPFASSIVSSTSAFLVVYIVNATSRGGTPVLGASSSVTLSTTVTNAVWSAANLNAQEGHDEGQRPVARGAITVTAAALSYQEVDAYFPFVPVGVQITATDSVGQPVERTGTLTFGSLSVIPGVSGYFSIVIDGTGTPYQAGDKITYTAWGAAA